MDDSIGMRLREAEAAYERMMEDRDRWRDFACVIGVKLDATLARIAVLDREGCRGCVNSYKGKPGAVTGMYNCDGCWRNFSDNYKKREGAGG